MWLTRIEPHAVDHDQRTFECKACGKTEIEIVKYRWPAFNVCFGSLADICGAKGHVRFTPNSDRKSRHAENGHVRFAPESGHVRCN
jgi:hypothetical protein